MTKFAFVFPGQGSQAIAMMNGFADNAVVAQTIAEASDALSFDLGKLIAEGPKEELDLTTNTQPVMLTAAVAIYRAWIAAGGPLPSVAFSAVRNCPNALSIEAWSPAPLPVPIAVRMLWRRSVAPVSIDVMLASYNDKVVPSRVADADCDS